MALSNCPECWDTPCTCGHKGCITIRKEEVPEDITKEQILELVKKYYGISEDR